MKTAFPMLIALVVAVCSCNRDDDTQRSLLATIPATSRVIAVMNMEECFRLAGGYFSDGELRLPAQVGTLLTLDKDVEASLRMLAEWRYNVDLRQVAVVYDDSTRRVVFAADRALERWPEGEHSSLTLERVGSGRFYPGDGAAAFVNDQRVWISSVTDKDDAIFLDSLMVRADRLSVATYKPLRDFFVDSSLVKIAVKVPHFANPIGDDIGSVLCDVASSGRSVQISAQFLDSLGHQANPFARLSPIDDNIYTYLPVGTVLAIALGTDRNTFRNVLSAVGRHIPLQERMATELASGFLCDSASTIALGFAPGGAAETIKRFSLDTWGFTALLPIETDRTEEFLDIVDELSDGKLYGDIAGEYFVLSNWPVDEIATGEVAEPAPGTSKFSVLAVVPYKGELMKAMKMNQGLNLELGCADGAMKLRVSLLGDGKYVIPAIVSIINPYVVPEKSQKGKRRK